MLPWDIHQHYDFDPETEYERLDLSDDWPDDPVEDGDMAWQVGEFSPLWDVVSGDYDLCCIESIAGSLITFDMLDDENPEHDLWWDQNDGYPNYSAVYLMSMRDETWVVLVDGRYFVDSRGRQREPALRSARYPSGAIAAAADLLTERELAFLRAVAGLG